MPTPLGTALPTVLFVIASGCAEESPSSDADAAEEGDTAAASDDCVAGIDSYDVPLTDFVLDWSGVDTATDGSSIEDPSIFDTIQLFSLDLSAPDAAERLCSDSLTQSEVEGYFLPTMNPDSLSATVDLGAVTEVGDVAIVGLESSDGTAYWALLVGSATATDSTVYLGD
jgi:hypothetical protein